MNTQVKYLAGKAPFQWIRASFAVVAAFIALSAGTAAAEIFYYGCVLDGDQETAPTASPAIGGGQFIIDTDANTMTYNIAFVGLVGAETAAHIHGPAGPGTNGGALTALPAGNPKNGVWNFTESQQADILGGKTYVNIHTAAFPGGEVRGQITPFNASLDGTQEVPSVTTPARGWGVFNINTALNELEYYIFFGGLMGAETAAHIHGPALHGSNGGVATALPAGSPKVGTWVYDESLEDGILSGHYYVNIHSGAFPGGEIRGQIVPTVVPIDGQQEVPPSGSPGAGVALLCIDRLTDDLSYDVRFAGIAGSETAAHIHGFAPPGSNAGVLQALPAGNRKIGVWNFGAPNETQVVDGLTYFNVHTTVVPGGEIRGQIMGLPGGVTSDVDLRDAFAGSLALTRMAPNPLQSSGQIQFQLEQAGPVQVALYDMQGRLIRDLGERHLTPGEHAVPWDGRDDAGRPVGSGVYRYVLQTRDAQISRPVTLVR